MGVAGNTPGYLRKQPQPKNLNLDPCIANLIDQPRKERSSEEMNFLTSVVVNFINTASKTADNTRMIFTIVNNLMVAEQQLFQRISALLSTP